MINPPEFDRPYKTLVADPYILIVFGNDGSTYYYGVFDSRIDAITFGQTECSGFRFQATRLIAVKRKRAKRSR